MLRCLATVLAMLFIVLDSTPGSASDPCGDDTKTVRTLVGLPDHRETGNRVIEPCVPFDGGFEDFELDERPAWVVAHPGQPGDRWILTFQDGGASEFRDGRTSQIESELPSGSAAPRAEMANGGLSVNPRTDPAGTADPIPHGRSVSTGFVAAALAGPTDRYPHGVLGDSIEASALEISSDDGSNRRVELPGHEVIEGISAIAAPSSDDGRLGFLVTVSDAEDGARLRAYDEYGEIIAESDPIGRGFRWMHQIGVGRTGPDGEVEVIAVRTPHIGGVLEAYQLAGDHFELVAAIEGYSSHVIGSPNLDMALLADSDADGQLEVIVPTQDMTELAVLDRTKEGFEEIMRLPLGGRLTTNVAAAIDEHGRLSLAAGTDDGRLRVFR